MKSKAQFRSHPIHPILVGFPIAFFTGCFIADLLSFWFAASALRIGAYYLNLAGVVMGLIAAIPGLIDLLGTVPPKSSARSRAIKHGLINTGLIIIFIGAFLIRQSSTLSDITLIITEFTGLVLMTIAGFMGGTLVYRNQIGVDMRYAGAGKWREIAVEQRRGTIRLIQEEELAVNQMCLIRLPEKRIVLARTEQEFVAFDDRCSHRGGSLAGGSMICGTVQCPWHGSHFDVKTGAVKAGPAEHGISVYPVKVEGGSVFLQLD